MSAPARYSHDRFGLMQGFMRSLERVPDRPALHVNGETFTYEALGRIAGAVAATITQSDQGSNALVTLLAHRSLAAYAGTLGILASGRGYVPINPKLPRERQLSILNESRSRIMLAGKEARRVLQDLAPKLTGAYTILLFDADEEEEGSREAGPHRILRVGTPTQAPEFVRHSVQGSDPIAYLLFTSGSTGVPKGVPVRDRNVLAYLAHIARRYGPIETDRFSQSFDLSFDLSVHDLFVCWAAGACLYSIPEQAVMAPAKFIRDHEITMWFSVPSVVGVMSKLGMLKPGGFPSLRGSLFCGEPLPCSYAAAWQQAAPNSFVENLYGPTETTIAITRYTWDPAHSSEACEMGIVPIGFPFDDQSVCVVDADLQPVERGGRGELCLSGSQVTGGYWNNSKNTDRQFVSLPGSGNTVWYRTGDLVKQNQDGCLRYLGRIDNQVKIRGYRVELQEIDQVLRRAADAEQVVALPWPVTEGVVEGVAAFVSGAADPNVARIVSQCRESLPEYMVPKRIFFLDTLPVNIHGKTDRLKLRQMLEEWSNEDLGRA